MHCSPVLSRSKPADLGIPGFEERGIEQIHVRGGRANETGFMVDGMYIENPLYGGKGKGTRLNQFAVAQVDFQTGFFNAEYGDAMSGMINTVTRTGPDKFTGMLRLERSKLSDLFPPNRTVSAILKKLPEVSADLYLPIRSDGGPVLIRQSRLMPFMNLMTLPLTWIIL
ncbi:MAG: TonB-dependent receptor plug domain-containing protein [Candidatus Marinimicrobia bacterium]|nr:TonB-dependent receptor plug domain-containing protein [Candidatus Neomarinimicrobiota bacterium]